MCKGSSPTLSSWSAPMVRASRPTASPAKASPIPASTAPFREFWDVTPAISIFSDYRRQSSRLTGGAAMAPGLTDRGTIAEGKAADLVIFDPNVIADQATYDDPHQYPNGIETVIVNGVTVIDHGEHTGALPGRLLRRRGAILT